MDSRMQDLLRAEELRQKSQLSFIASENLVSASVARASASVATNKYAEGYGTKRYYAGCSVVNDIENEAIQRAKKLFQVDHVNVQAHAGATANLAAMMALLKPGDPYMGLDLAHGGHLSHGSPVNVSSLFYKPSMYQLATDERLDFAAMLKQAQKIRPKMIIAGFSAYSRVIDWQAFREVADEVGATLLADVSHVAGLIAAGVFPSPSPYADVITTTTHKTLRGPRGALIMVPNNEELAKRIDKAVFPGSQGGPMMHTIAAKAVAFQEALSSSFKEYQKQVLRAAKRMSTRFLTVHGIESVSGGTDTHQFTLKCAPLGASGKEVEAWCEQAGILVNKNTIPFDTQSVWVTSGVRFGTALITSRGIQEHELDDLVDGIAKLIHNKGDAQCIQALNKSVQSLCAAYPNITPNFV